ncbi:MAG TPA: glycosyltransferase [Gemmatimonadaceae bacterium]|nr:glycosyltransferase [Gemmatimonadaceae bacterium]
MSFRWMRVFPQLSFMPSPVSCCMTLDLSIVIATCMRASSLERTLASIAASSYPLDHVQVVIADNADDPDTRGVRGRCADRLELTYLVATTPGKNAALNAALPSITGDLVLFTDDDVEVSPDWLAETSEAAARWPEHVVFGGKVLPLWPPASMPAYVNDQRYLGICFTVLDPKRDEGPSFSFTPFGPNVAIRRSVFDAGVRFNPHVGPHRASYIMGSETELIGRLKRQGHAPVFMPQSVVWHRIRPEQFSDRWLFGRAFRYGRLMEVRRQEAQEPARSTLRHVPEVLGCLAYAGLARAKGERKAWFDQIMELSTTCGMIYQSWQASPLEEDESLEQMIPASPAGGVRL